MNETQNKTCRACLKYGDISLFDATTEYGLHLMTIACINPVITYSFNVDYHFY